MALEAGELVIIVKAITAELQAGMAQATAAVQSAAAGMRTGLASMEAQSAASQTAVQRHAAATGAGFTGLRERVNIGLSGASASLRAFGLLAGEVFAVLSVERFLANAIKAAQEYAFEVEHLSKTLGVSTQEASVYAVALKETGVGQEAIDRAARGLVRTLNSNQAAFANIKLSVKDAHGELLPFPELLERTLNRLDQYKEGVDRMAAAQSVFGGRVMPETLQGLRRFLDDLPHAREVTDAYGLALDPAGVARARAYERATADLSLALLGVKERIATELMPQIERFSATLLRLTKEGTLAKWGDDAKVAVGKVGSALIDSLPLLRQWVTLYQLWQNLTPPPAPVFPPLSAHGESPDAALAGLKPAGTETFAGTAAARAKAEKAAYDDLKSRQDADLKFFEKNEQAKLEVVRAYSAAIQRIRGLTPEQAREQATKELEQEQHAANQERQLSDLTIEHDVKNQIRRLDEEGKVLETKRRLGQLSVDELLVQETDLENRRTAIVSAGIRDRLALIDPQRDPVAYKRVSEEIEDAEAEHQRRLTDLLRKADAERAKAESDTQKHLERLFNDIGGAFDTAIGAVVDHNQKASEVIRSIWQSLAKDILKMIGEIAAKQAVIAITGLPGKPGQGASSLLAEALTSGGGKLLGGAGTTDPRLAAEQKVQAQLTSIEQAGFLKRAALAVAHYTRVGILAAAHYAKEIALGAFALAKWIAAQGLKLAIHIATETAITAVSIVEGAARHAADIASVIKSIIAYAYKAAAGAASAVASIPYAGPILAVANYAAILATVLGGVSSVSAAGGLEDTGPSALVTLLHPREMVLPAAIAESVRRGATAGTTATGGEVHHHHHQITIHAVDAHSFEQLLRRKPHVIADIAARGVSARPARGRHP